MSLHSEIISVMKKHFPKKAVRTRFFYDYKDEESNEYDAIAIIEIRDLRDDDFR